MVASHAKILTAAEKDPFKIANKFKLAFERLQYDNPSNLEFYALISELLIYILANRPFAQPMPTLFAQYQQLAENYFTLHYEMPQNIPSGEAHLLVSSEILCYMFLPNQWLMNKVHEYLSMRDEDIGTPFPAKYTDAKGRMSWHYFVARMLGINVTGTKSPEDIITLLRHYSHRRWLNQKYGPSAKNLAQAIHDTLNEHWLLDDPDYRLFIFQTIRTLFINKQCMDIPAPAQAALLADVRQRALEQRNPNLTAAALISIADKYCRPAVRTISRLTVFKPKLMIERSETQTVTQVVAVETENKPENKPTSPTLEQAMAGDEGELIKLITQDESGVLIRRANKINPILVKKILNAHHRNDIHQQIPDLLGILEKSSRATAHYILLRCGVNLEYPNQIIFPSIVHIAASMGHTTALKHLHAYDPVWFAAKLDVRNRPNDTPLFLAAGNHHLQTVEYLAKSHPNCIRYQRDNYPTIFHLYAERYSHKKVISILIEADPAYFEQVANVRYADNGHFFQRAIAGDNADALKAMILHSIDFFTRVTQENNMNLLLNACLHGSVKCVKVFTEHAPHLVRKWINSPSQSGMSALSIAIESNRFQELIPLLIGAGADLEWQINQTNPPITLLRLAAGTRFDRTDRMIFLQTAAPDLINRYKHRHADRFFTQSALIQCPEASVTKWMLKNNFYFHRDDIEQYFIREFNARGFPYQQYFDLFISLAQQSNFIRVGLFQALRQVACMYATDPALKKFRQTVLFLKIPNHRLYGHMTSSDFPSRIWLSYVASCVGLTVGAQATVLDIQKLLANYREQVANEEKFSTLADQIMLEIQRQLRLVWDYNGRNYRDALHKIVFEFVKSNKISSLPIRCFELIGADFLALAHTQSTPNFAIAECRAILEKHFEPSLRGALFATKQPRL